VENFKDWQVFATYSKVESDATFDEFSDSDFRSGGTNNKAGHSDTDSASARDGRTHSSITLPKM